MTLVKDVLELEGEEEEIEGVAMDQCIASLIPSPINKTLLSGFSDDTLTVVGNDINTPNNDTGNIDTHAHDMCSVVIDLEDSGIGNMLLESPFTSDLSIMSLTSPLATFEPFPLSPEKDQYSSHTP